MIMLTLLSHTYHVVHVVTHVHICYCTATSMRPQCSLVMRYPASLQMNFSTEKNKISAVAEEGCIKTIFLTAAAHVGRGVAWVFHHLRESMSWSTSVASAKQDGNLDLRALKKLLVG